MSECRHENARTWLESDGYVHVVCAACDLRDDDLLRDFKRQRDEARAAVERLADELGSSVGCAACPMGYDCEEPVASQRCVSVIRKWAYSPAAVPKHQAVAMLEKVCRYLSLLDACPESRWGGHQDCRQSIEALEALEADPALCLACWREACGLSAKDPEKDAKEVVE